MKISLKRIFLIACFFGICFQAYAQGRLEKLSRELAREPADTHRVSLLYDVAWDYLLDSVPEQAEKMLWEAVTLGQRLHFKAGEANAWNGLGVLEEDRGNFQRAISYYEQSLNLRSELGNPLAIAKSYSNIGKSYGNLGDYSNAFKYLRQCLNICEQLNNKEAIARAAYGLGVLQQEMGLYEKAYQNIRQYREYVEEVMDPEGRALAYTQLGHNRFELEMYDVAKDWYEKSLKIREELADSSFIADAMVDLANALDELDTTRTGMAIPYYMRALSILQHQEDQDAAIASLYNSLADAFKHLKNFNTGLIYAEKALEISSRLGDQNGIMEVYNTYGDILFGMKNLKKSLSYVEQYFDLAQKLKDEKYIQKGYKDFAKLYSALGDYKKAFEYRVKYDTYRYKRLNERRITVYEQQDVLFADYQKQREIERMNQQQLLLQERLKTDRIVGYALVGGALLLVLLTLLLFNRNRIRARANRELAAKNATIEQERARADNLLKNILPEKTAEELKLHNVVQPVRYENVTVLFSDFKGFTSIAELVSPEDLIRELDECFRLFDEIAAYFQIEKIKTIGDSYMCVAGLPEPNPKHAVVMVQAAIVMQQRLKVLMDQKRLHGKPIFEMRIGINSGPVVAGVVGSHKFAYDIWGDTVNTAARLEQGGEVHKINISSNTYTQVKDHFTCTYRGKMAAKNKGDIDMYFVEYAR